MAEQFVTISHPSLPEAEPARVTRKAFDKIHQPKGWEVVGDAPATTDSNVQSLSLQQQLKVAQAEQVADVVTDADKAEIPVDETAIAAVTTGLPAGDVESTEESPAPKTTARRSGTKAEG